ncbi:MAG: AMP-binding protein [Bdellovibrionales bacterium]|nr:AMP-binding protein [Bdellovibrionales bacterium]
MKLLINESKIDWTSPQSHYFFNTRHPQALEFRKIAQQIPILKKHIYLYTSSYSKICLLSKKALLFSARLVNQNLQASSKDRWLICLPFFHVSGISILARVFLSRSSYFIQEGAWNPYVFRKRIQEEKITLSSVVPTQIYDLVQKGLTAPKSLRVLLVGGDYLSPDIYKKARELFWPLLICYGATETCSQIASSSLDSLKENTFPKMKILPSIQVESVQKKKDGYGFLKVKSQALVSAYFDLEKRKIYDPKDKEACFVLKDFALLKENHLKIRTRFKEQIKILGESVNLQKLRLKLKELSQKQGIESFLLSIPDKRRGCCLSLLGFAGHFEKLSFLAKQFNQEVSGYEKIQNLYLIFQTSQYRFLKLKPEFFLEKLGLKK